MLVFDKWDTSEVKVTDPGLAKYINLNEFVTFHTHGRHAARQFAKSNISIIERLINNVMRSGSGRKVGGKLIDGRLGCGKKSKAIKCVREAFEIIHKKTGKNPIQVYIKALENAAPREETTRVKMGGITRLISVDISPQRRIDFALRNICVAMLGKSYKSKKSRAEALADELIAAANNDTSSLAISKKVEIERVAKGAR
ncbi:MAG: 30S ribosomal protein S7 [Candidatus Diapherotrites archaeon]|nr:30S ribosomal protein S7 [Candidatus Diapherotrites archaeon]